MRIALIGGGPAAVALLDALITSASSSRLLEIKVYEPAGRVGPGRAYRRDLDSALINRQAGLMSVRSNEPRHFLRWLWSSDEYRETPFGTAEGESFLPRSVFGDYLESHFALLTEIASKQGFSVSVCSDRAVAAKQTSDGMRIRTAQGAIEDFDKVVLCLGTGEPGDPYGLAGAPNFLADPYPLTAMAPAIPAEARVLVLGTGLAAVDVALALRDQGHCGPVVLASRRGALPAVRAPFRTWTLTELAPVEVELARRQGRPLGLAAVRAGLLGELARAGVSESDVATRFGPCVSNQEKLRNEILEAKAGANDWQRVAIAAASEIAEDVWYHLPDHERRKFLETYHHIFNAECNPMPLPTAVKISNLLENGFLEAVSGISGVRSTGDEKFTYVDAAGSHTADVVVNATRGSTGSVSRSAKPLIASLKEQRVVTGHRFGGIRVEFATNRVIAPSGQVHPHVYALGDLTAGDLYFTSSQALITRRARMIADSLRKVVEVQPAGVRP